jgi:hypothetical protein
MLYAIHPILTTGCSINCSEKKEVFKHLQLFFKGDREIQFFPCKKIIAYFE